MDILNPFSKLSKGKMRRLTLASYDKIMLNINAVIMLQKRGESAMRNVTIGMDLGDKNHVITILNEAGVSNFWWAAELYRISFRLQPGSCSSRHQAR